MSRYNRKVPPHPLRKAQSITPDTISVGELKAGARHILSDIRDSHRAVVIADERGTAMGILVSPEEFGRLHQARGAAGLGPLRNRLAQHFPHRVRVAPNPGGFGVAV